jgi:hypothetical protein
MSCKWTVLHGIGYSGIQECGALHGMMQREGLALSGFLNLVFRHLVGLLGHAVGPSQGLSVYTEQHRRIAYICARSGIKIKSNLFVEAQLRCYGCDCYHQVFVSTHPLYLSSEDRR